MTRYRNQEIWPDTEFDYVFGRSLRLRPRYPAELNIRPRYMAGFQCLSVVFVAMLLISVVHNNSQYLQHKKGDELIKFINTKLTDPSIRSYVIGYLRFFKLDLKVQ